MWCSDSTATSAACHPGKPTSTGKDDKDWALDSSTPHDTDSQAAEAPGPQVTAGNEPVHFPTAKDHPPQERHERISQAAYRYFEQRGEQPGSAESQQIANHRSGSPGLR